MLEWVLLIRRYTFGLFVVVSCFVVFVFVGLIGLVPF